MPNPIKPTAVNEAAAENAASAANLVTNDGYYEFDLEKLTNAFAIHAQHARDQALEEAARVADEQARRAWVIAKELGQNGVCASGRNYGARDVAQAIRSLITDLPATPESATQ